MDCVKLKLPIKKQKNILALGADSKAGFCIVKNGTAYLYNEPYGLYEIDKKELFEKKIFSILRRTGVNPKAVACDLHPYYNSVALAKSMRDKKINQIQHHKAHIAGCLADNGIKDSVIGVAFDGTGFGSDGNIWGGEFFTGNLNELRRVAHLRYAPMPGGEICARESWRMGLSYLYNTYGPAVRKLNIGFLKSKNRDRINLLTQAMDKKINSPRTSSMGRFFDGVSAILGICESAGYEGEAAVALENSIKCGAENIKHKERYTFDYNNREEVIEIDWRPVIKDIVGDLQADTGYHEISKKFHDSLCYMIKDICVLLGRRFNLSNVCLSGGVFQNKYLTKNVKPLLEKEGFEVFFHKRIPAHDGGIAVGQAVMAI